MLRLRLASVAIVAVAACSFTPGGDGGDDDDLVDPDGGGGDDDGGGGDAPGGGLLPSNGANASDLEGVSGLVVVPAGRVVVFDVDDGAILSYQGTTPTTVRAAGTGLIAGIRFRIAIEKNGGPQIAVFSMESLVQAGSLRIIGDRPAIFLVRDAVAIAGEIDIGGGRTGPLLATECQACPGPGGGGGFTTLVAASGCAPGLGGAYDVLSDETGGGGGGFGFVGAAGGDSDAPGGGVTPIGLCPGVSLQPLLGGSGGGRGGYDLGNSLGGSAGGGGGGALQLTSMVSIEIMATADLYAGGAGGTGSDSRYGGGGGGAGGAFLLEAPKVTIESSAKITANGGGGGSGRTGNRGENGGRVATRASGGAGTGIGGADGRGGLGGIGGGGMAATQGNGLVDGTGGGGGGAGIIRINTFEPPTVSSGAVISPPPSLGTAAGSQSPRAADGPRYDSWLW